MITSCKMDLAGVRVYLSRKNLLFFILFSTLFMYFTGVRYFPTMFAMTFSLIFMTYPFLLGEKSGIEGLYRMMGIENRDVVGGRYLYAVAIFWLFTILAFVITSAVDLIKFGRLFPAETMLIVLIYFMIYLIFIDLNLPIFFALGYKEAKGAAAVALMVMVFLLVGISGFFTGLFPGKVEGILIGLTNHIGALIIAGASVVALATFISYRLALRKFQTGDL